MPFGRIPIRRAAEGRLEHSERNPFTINEKNLGTATLTTPERLLANEITVFNDRVRIDVQTATPALLFGEVWARKDVITYLGNLYAWWQLMI